MKTLIFIIFVVLIQSSDSKKIEKENLNISLKDMMNQEIIDGFFEGDTTGISKNYYFIE